MHFPRTKVANFVGYSYGIVCQKSAVLIYRYGMDHERASRGCLGSLLLHGDGAIALLERLELATASGDEDAQMVSIDAILGECQESLRPDIHHRCSSDGILVRFE